MADRQPIPLPPTAPSTRRRISPTRKQWLGIPVLATIPILALAGVFERRSIARAQSADLSVSVAFPERLRYRQTPMVEISVTNRSSRVLDTVLVSIDTAYVARFTDVRIEPPAVRAFVVAHTAVRPGESRLTTMQIAGERIGVQRGRVVVTAGGEPAVVSLRTLVFP